MSQPSSRSLAEEVREALWVVARSRHHADQATKRTNRRAGGAALRRNGPVRQPAGCHPLRPAHAGGLAAPMVLSALGARRAVRPSRHRDAARWCSTSLTNSGSPGPPDQKCCPASSRPPTRSASSASSVPVRSHERRDREKAPGRRGERAKIANRPPVQLKGHPCLWRLASNPVALLLRVRHHEPCSEGQAEGPLQETSPQHHETEPGFTQAALVPRAVPPGVLGETRDTNHGLFSALPMPP